MQAQYQSSLLLLPFWRHFAWTYGQKVKVLFSSRLPLTLTASLPDSTEV